MKKFLASLLSLFLLTGMCLAQNGTSYDKYGSKTGSYKTSDSTTTQYNRYGQKTNSYKTNGNNTTSYDKYGHKT